MELQHFIGLMVVAGVTVGCNFLSTRHFSQAQQRQSSDYDSVRLAAVLERFSYDCAEVISLHAVSRASNGNLGEILPEMPYLKFPEDTVWKNLDLMLVDRLLRLQNDVARAESVIQSDYRHLEHDDYPSEPTAQAGLMGYQAHVLAQDLRAEYPAIRAASNIYPWDFVSTLKEHYDMKMAEYARSKSV